LILQKRLFRKCLSPAKLLEINSEARQNGKSLLISDSKVAWGTVCLTTSSKNDEILIESVSEKIIGPAVEKIKKNKAAYNLIE
jgi:hypothetical protein